MIGIGLGLSFIKGGGNSAEALAWKTNIEANGGTISQALLDIFDSNFFIPAKANGNILTELDRLNIYCGLVGYEIAARTNLIKNAHYVTPVSSPIWDNNGYKSGGTSYLNLNYTPSTQASKLLLNSCFGFFCYKNPPFASTFRPMGVISGGGRLDFLEGTTTSQSFLNSTTATDNSNLIKTGYVYISGLRKNSTTQSSLINLNKIDSAITSTALPDASLYELCLNNSNSPTGPFDTNYHLCSGHGSGNVDYLNLQTILNNLFTALGV